MKILTSTALVLVLAAPALAQDAVTITTIESEAFGDYLADENGRPLYRFTADSQAGSDQPAEMTCTSEACLENWPPLIVTEAPEAGQGVDAALLDTIEHDGGEVVTYDGWPLYTFGQDEAGAEPQGHEAEAFGGEWLLAAPVEDAPEQTAALDMSEADIAAGENLYAQDCAQCHGRTGRGMASFPAVAGADAEHIASRLIQYRAGETVGPNSALMIPVAQPLSDEEIADLAAFISETF